jgi:hypothetical protein
VEDGLPRRHGQGERQGLPVCQGDVRRRVVRGTAAPPRSSVRNRLFLHSASAVVVFSSAALLQRDTFDSLLRRLVMPPPSLTLYHPSQSLMPLPCNIPGTHHRLTGVAARSSSSASCRPSLRMPSPAPDGTARAGRDWLRLSRRRLAANTRHLLTSSPTLFGLALARPMSPSIGAYIVAARPSGSGRLHARN